MSITLTAGAQTITLPPDLYWEDEMHTPVLQAVDMSARGRPLIHINVAAAGAAVTLRPWSPNCGWTQRSVLLQCVALTRVPDQRMTLNIRGEQLRVMWRIQDRAIDWEPVVFFRDAAGTDYVHATFRFMTVLED